MLQINPDVRKMVIIHEASAEYLVSGLFSGGKPYFVLVASKVKRNADLSLLLYMLGSLIPISEVSEI
jgi:hypothetical protein